MVKDIFFFSWVVDPVDLIVFWWLLLGYLNCTGGMGKERCLLCACHMESTLTSDIGQTKINKPILSLGNECGEETTFLKNTMENGFSCTSSTIIWLGLCINKRKKSQIFVPKTWYFYTFARIWLQILSSFDVC